VFLGKIKAAFDKNPELTNLLLDDFFRDAIHKCQVRSSHEVEFKRKRE
jgi:6-phosphogluconate dehydrogenase